MINGARAPWIRDALGLPPRLERRLFQVIALVPVSDQPVGQHGTDQTLDDESRIVFERCEELSEDRRHELYLDSTFFVRGSPSNRNGILHIAYQHNFTPREKNTFYFTAGGGPLWYSDRNNREFTFTAGGGVGARQNVSGGHGTMREELRADFVADTEFFQRTFIISAKFGFDLWFR